MRFLQQLDWNIFYWINHGWDHPISNAFFPAITDLHKESWFFVLILPLLGFSLYRKYQKNFWKPFFWILLAVGTCDSFAGKVIKPLVARQRPPLQVEDVILRAPHYGGNSFPSNHAANMFCLAVLLGFVFPRARIPLLIVALLVSLSRVYVGVHFPSDVFLGGIYGVLWAFLFIFLGRKKIFYG